MNRKQGHRTLASYIPVITAVVGVTLVATSVVFFFVDDDQRRITWVTIGLGILLISVWFAANPFTRKPRRFHAPRSEVVGFLDLVRLLHRQVVGKAAPEDVERTTAKMHEAVERMVAEADNTS